MESNTFISQELEEMRSQISLLRNKLEKQAIVNDQHIRRSMQSKMSDINRTILASIIAGGFALPYCTWYFWYQGLSIAFVAATALMLAVCLGLTIAKQTNLKKLDFANGNLIEVAETLGGIRKHYQEWIKIAVPMILIWFSWLIYEMFNELGATPMTLGFCCGALVGLLTGGFIAMRMNKKVIDRTTEILDHIKELQQGE